MGNDIDLKELRLGFLDCASVDSRRAFVTNFISNKHLDGTPEHVQILTTLFTVLLEHDVRIRGYQLGEISVNVYGGWQDWPFVYIGLCSVRTTEQEAKHVVQELIESLGLKSTNEQISYFLQPDPLTFHTSLETLFDLVVRDPSKLYVTFGSVMPPEEVEAIQGAVEAANTFLTAFVRQHQSPEDDEAFWFAEVELEDGWVGPKMVAVFIENEGYEFSAESFAQQAVASLIEEDSSYAGRITARRMYCK